MGNIFEPQCTPSLLGPDDNEGSLKAKYELGMFPKRLGQGQFSKAYECSSRDSHEEAYALKVFFQDADAADHAKNELRVLRVLGHHPRIIRVVECDREEPFPLRLVLELCRGGQLFDRIKERGRYDEQDACAVTRQILEAVAFMHGRGVMHRDLKPENILLVSEDNDIDIKVCDFGIAKVADRGFMPRSTSFLGSDYYLAPEMIRQEEYGPEVDVWAAGVSTYAVLSGTLPFMGEGGDLRQTYEKIVERDLKFDGEAWEDKSELAMDFVSQMLLVQRDKRPNAATALHHPWLVHCGLDEDTVQPQVPFRSQRPLIAGPQLSMGSPPSVICSTRQAPYMLPQRTGDEAPASFPSVRIDMIARKISAPAVLNGSQRVGTSIV